MKETALFLKDTAFKDLMSIRVREILLVCSKYDKFMLEEDGRIDELLFQEYMSLSLHYPPKFTQVSTAREAEEALKGKYYDLVILMLSVGESEVLNLARNIKKEFPTKPVVFLSPVSTGAAFARQYRTEENVIDYIFYWQGNPGIMLAMVKLLEDRMNVDPDVNNVGVQCIILVEDSVRYYSSYLPVFYETLFKQAKSLMKEGLNEWEQTVRMRGRPKILLARTYEEAVSLYEKYKSNVLGIISDIAYKKDGEINNKAGIALCDHIRKEDSDLPILLQSSQEEHEKEAIRYGASFIRKNTKNLLKELEQYINMNYGFGDFVFRNPETMEPVGRAKSLRELQHQILTIDDEIFTYHVNNNEISRWLKARALFGLADYLRPKTVSDFTDLTSMKQYIHQMIKEFRVHQGRGVIAEFNSSRFDELTFFSRIGSGSLGGKGRALAFVDQQLKHYGITRKFENVLISIPRTIVLTTEIFDEFMNRNNLFNTALADIEDEKILKAFLEADLPDWVKDNLESILKGIKQPVAVRSSSLLEDSRYQPFAGIYSTYMLPNNSQKLSHRLKDLCSAIKSVYASTYMRQSKDYMKATGNIVEDEKMAVIIQEVTGRVFGERCYPNISGVARSLNFYPLESEKPEEGIANIAFGFGKTVVDGGVSLRFSPYHPKKIIQLSSPQEAMKSTQKKFYSLDMKRDLFTPDLEKEGNLVLLDLEKAEPDGSLSAVASTYDFQNNRLRDGISREGKRILTFSGILKYSMFPLAEILQTLLEFGREIMNTPIEIEFAVNLHNNGKKYSEFSFLQLRPIAQGSEGEEVKIIETVDSETLILSDKAMGNGIYKNIRDLIYIKPETFNPAETKKMGQLLGKLNSEMEKNRRNYVLVVPGRLGSTDPWLGIPIKWPEISMARIITETGTAGFRVEPSQGTHFFQNITSLGCAYLTINPYIDDGVLNTSWLDSLEAESENEFIRHVSFPDPLDIRVDGRRGKAVVRYNRPG